MEAILIEPRNGAEMKVARELIKKMNIPFFIIGEENKKKLAATKMMEIASKHPKYDLSDEEIVNMVSEDEEDLYGKK
ncbi:MAG: hypothetical protein ABI261_04775 [Ginsengibacter sp.]